MSDDIAYQLRMAADIVDSGLARLRCRQGADEIERLRAELANVQWQLDFVNDCLTRATGYLADEGGKEG